MKFEVCFKINHLLLNLWTKEDVYLCVAYVNKFEQVEKKKDNSKCAELEEFGGYWRKS